MKLYSYSFKLFIVLEVHKVTSSPRPLSWRRVIRSQADFIKVIARFQVDPQAFRISGMLLSRKIYFFTALHLAATAGEPEIFTASKRSPLS